MHPLTLSFMGEKEKRFSLRYLHKNLNYVRAASIIATILWLVFFVLDTAWASVEQIECPWKYYYLLTFPFQLLTVIISWIRKWRLALLKFMAIAVMSVSATMVVIDQYIPPGSDIPIEFGFILLTIAGYTFFRFRFIYGVVIGLFTILSFTLDGVLIGMSSNRLVYDFIILVVANVFGGFAGYALEYYERILYISRERAVHSRQIELEMTNLRTVQELARAVAHEFNNPLHVIQGIYELHMEPDIEEKDTMTRERLKRIPAMVDRMSGLVQKLLAITKIRKRDYLSGAKMIDLGVSAKVDDE